MPSPTTPRPSSARKPTDRAKKQPTAAERRAAEENPDCYVGVLDGQTIRVLPQGKWRKSAMQRLRTADLDGWAVTAVHKDDLELFKSTDPTNDDFQQFFQEALEWSGVDIPESSASQQR